MKFLVIIPARGGSKGIPHKNIKPLGGKPLIQYAIETARQLTDDDNICVSTDDDDIIATVEQTGLKVPFRRPDSLATDGASSYDVIMHAINFYERQGRRYEAIVLLQPTSPFRSVDDVRACLAKYSPDYEMVVSVKPAAANPYYDCFEADAMGYLTPSKGNGSISRRQDAPKVYEYSGAVYVMSVEALKRGSYSHFRKIGFVEMDEVRSIDLDTPMDWKMAELILNDKDMMKHVLCSEWGGVALRLKGIKQLPLQYVCREGSAVVEPSKRIAA